MAHGKQEVPELVRVAEALESDLARFEALSRSVRKIHLDTEKSIGRAARELNEAVAMPDRIAEGLRTLASAMERMQARQLAALESLTACAANIQERMRRLGEHMQAFAALGKAAAEATVSLQSESEVSADTLGGVKTQLSKITDDARALFESARADDFPEVAREADTLEQRIASLRRRLDGKG